ncbi:MAG: PilZ domain-containing protein [Planctomycetes bacterium]|nr:PilZ domain-containing protein [Planctomycetota bacterium]
MTATFPRTTSLTLGGSSHFEHSPPPERRSPAVLEQTWHGLVLTARKAPRACIGRAQLDVPLRPAAPSARASMERERICAVTMELKDPTTGETYTGRGELRFLGLKEGAKLALPAAPPDLPTATFVPIRLDGTASAPAAPRAAKPAAEPTAELSTAPLASDRRTESSERRAFNCRRRAERFQIYDYSVIAHANGRLLSLSRTRNIAQRVVDLSSTGIQLECAQNPKIGSQLFITIHLNRFSDTIAARARVLWTSESPLLDGKIFATGLVFDEMHPAQRRQLEYMERWFNSAQARMRMSRIDGR